jgi:hypothetical protein
MPPEFDAIETYIRAARLERSAHLAGLIADAIVAVQRGLVVFYTTLTGQRSLKPAANPR